MSSNPEDVALGSYLPLLSLSFLVCEMGLAHRVTGRSSEAALPVLAMPLELFSMLSCVNAHPVKEAHS